MCDKHNDLLGSRTEGSSANLGVDPVEVVGDAGEDGGVAGGTAGLGAPGDHADQGPVAAVVVDQGS